MEQDQKWIVVRIDGKVAAISTGYAALAAIAERLAQEKAISHMNICAETVGFEQVWKLRQTLGWDEHIDRNRLPEKGVEKTVRPHT